MKENIKTGLIIAAFVIPIGLLMFCGMVADGTIPLATWNSSAQPVLLMEGETARDIDCLHQPHTFYVGNEKVFEDGKIQALWDDEDRSVDVNLIPDGIKVGIYEKKFWWIHRHFIVCE